MSSKIPALKAKDIIRVLRILGFNEVRTKQMIFDTITQECRKGKQSK